MVLSQTCRIQRIRGFSFPAIIHNGRYFLTDLDVFSDGLVNCWQMCDLASFKAKLSSGWVVPSIPRGEPINIHNMGVIQFDEPEWTHTSRSLLRFVRQTVKELNPRMENLYDFHGRETIVMEGVRYSPVPSTSPRPWKPDGPISPFLEGSFGLSMRHFRYFGGKLHLVRLEFYEDEMVLISGGPENYSMSFSDFSKQLDRSDFYRLPEPGDEVVIPHLVSFRAKDWSYRIESDDLALEIHDKFAQVCGRPGAERLCMQAYEAYLAKPTKAKLEELRDRYEAVPRHLRSYCGDMDTKDIPIRMILYGEEEIEKWSHYQVAKKLGHDLPTITIPDPPSDD